MCDIAQHKIINDPAKGNLHRIVYAIISPSTIKPRTNNDFWYYKFGPFVLKGKNVFMHFHFGTVGFEYLQDNRKQPAFSIKQEIVFDLQSKIASHVNRLGNSLLKENLVL